MSIARQWKNHPLRAWLVASAMAAIILQGLAALTLAEHFYPTYGSSWDHICDTTQDAQCASWHFAARSYEYFSLETYMVTATNSAISTVYNPLDIYYYSSSNADTGYFDADYGTAGGSWAWTSCAPGASYVGLDSTHNRDCDPEDVRYNLHYHDAKYDGATREKAIACHETGHIFGLLHNGSTSSCMHNTPGTATTLIQGEKDLLNANY